MSTLHTIKDRLIEVILNQHSLTKKTNTPSLESLKASILEPNLSLKTELNRLIEESTTKDKADLPLLNFLLQIVVLLNSFTHTNAFLDANQQKHVKEILIDLFTTLNVLCITRQTSTYKLKPGLEFRGFLDSKDNSGYSHIGEQISEKLRGLWNIETTDAEDELIPLTNDGCALWNGDTINQETLISYKVNLLVQTYQSEVEPKHLQLENQRLTNEVQQLKAQLENAESQNLILRSELNKNGIRLPKPDTDTTRHNVHKPFFSPRREGPNQQQESDLFCAQQ